MKKLSQLWNENVFEIRKSFFNSFFYNSFLHLILIISFSSTHFKSFHHISTPNSTLLLSIPQVNPSIAFNSISTPQINHHINPSYHLFNPSFNTTLRLNFCPNQPSIHLSQINVAFFVLFLFVAMFLSLWLQG